MTPRSCRIPALAAALLLALSGTASAQKLEAQMQNKGKFSEKLAQKVTIEARESPFIEEVKQLAAKYDLPLVVDPSVGKGENIDDKKIKLPNLINVRLDTVLRLVSEQVNAVYLVQSDHIKITDAVWGQYESGVLGQPDPNDDSPLLTVNDLQKAKPLIKRALVTASYKNVPLSEIIDDIAESTGATVNLSPLVGEAVAATKISVRFSNTPVDAAIRTICEMTELGAIEDANALLVTTAARAAAKAKEANDKRKSRMMESIGVVGGVGLGGAGGIPGGLLNDYTTEFTRLKEQNDALKKQLDEIQKLLKK